MAFTPIPLPAPLLAASELDLTPQECVLADDTAANLPPAEKLGMAAVHFTDQDAGIAEINRLLGLAIGQG